MLLKFTAMTVQKQYFNYLWHSKKEKKKMRDSTNKQESGNELRRDRAESNVREN
jgi:FtsZ-interacting cell division protein ZipA